MTAPPVIAPDPLASLPPLVRWLMQRCKPDPDALELVTPNTTLEQLYARWMEMKLFPSAIRLVASVLPARESIWWAWVSVRHATQMAGGKAPTAAQHEALANIERWIIRPDEETRRAAWDSANAAELQSAVGMVGAAVYLSGVSVGPANTPPVPPPPGAIVPIIPGAILLAASSNSHPEHIEPTLIAFATQGLEVVKRLGGWDAAAKNAYEMHQRAEQDYVRATQPPKR